MGGTGGLDFGRSTIRGVEFCKWICKGGRRPGCHHLVTEVLEPWYWEPACERREIREIREHVESMERKERESAF